MSNVKVIGGAPNAKEVMWVVNGSVNGAVSAIPGQVKNFSYDSTQWQPIRDGAANSYVSDVVGPVDHGNTSTTKPDTSFNYALIASIGRHEAKPGYEYYQSTADSSGTTVPGTTNNCSCAVTHDTMGSQVPKPMTDNLTSIPGEPPQIEVVAGVGEVTIKWTGPDIDGNLSIKGYKLFRGTRPTSLNIIHLSTNDSFSYVDNNRPTGTAYYYAVRAINDAGEGNLSQPIQVTVK